MKYLLPGLGVFVLLVIVIIINYPQPASDPQALDRRPLSIISIAPDGTQVEQVFAVEVAQTVQEKSMGLMFRTAMPENAGMIFLSTKPQQAAMWMKNTHIPLDMVFIDEAWKIHHIAKNTEPHSLTPITSNGEVIAVLELNGGAADKYSISVGDEVILDK